MRTKSQFNLITAGCLLVALAGCRSKSEIALDSGKTAGNTETKSVSAKTNGSQKAPVTDPVLQLLPRDTLAYIRINDVQRVKSRYLNPKHIKDAPRVRQQFNRLLQEAYQEFALKGSTLGVKGLTVLQLIGDLQNIHIAAWNPEAAKDKSAILDTNLLVVLQFARRQGIEELLSDLKPKLKPKEIADEDIQLLPKVAGSNTALFRSNSTTLVIGTVLSLEAALRQKSSGNKSLGDSRRFQQAYADWGTKGELFAYMNLQSARDLIPQIPFKSVTHLGAALRLDGGFSVRAYGGPSKPFPQFLVKSSREKKFLSRIPADAVFLASTGNSGNPARRNFFAWVMEELGQKDTTGLSLLPPGWKKMAASDATDPKNIEAQALRFIEDMWQTALPIKSESAFFISPGKSGRWGAAMLFDVDDKDQIRQLAEKLFEMGNRAKLPWKEIRHEGLTIRYVDFAQIAKAAGKPIPAEIAKRAQLQAGYAYSDQLFFVGTLDAIKFAHKPTGKTLDKELTYDNLDEKNSIMLSLRPGRILHRTFGVPQVDNVVKRLASQIPKDSNYAVTLNFEPTRLTFRTNIPFVSLIAWLVTEWKGKGPAGLHELLNGKP